MWRRCGASFASAAPASGFAGSAASPLAAIAALRAARSPWNSLRYLRLVARPRCLDWSIVAAHGWRASASS